MHQPYTTDTTPNGLMVARNAARLRLWADPVAAHNFLCHPDGERCPDGCQHAADPARTALYQSELEGR